MPKIISKCCELGKLCRINRSCPFFLRHSVCFCIYKRATLTKLPADSDDIGKNIGRKIHWHVNHLQVWEHNTKVLMHWCEHKFGISLDSILVEC